MRKYLIVISIFINAIFILGNDLNKNLEKILEDEVLKGLAVGVIKNNEVVYSEAFGVRRDYNSNGLQLNIESKVRIASISKFVTTLGYLKLVQSKKINLDKDISEYLGFLLRNPKYPDKIITSRMLLTHTSSLSDGGNDGLIIRPENKIQDLFSSDSDLSKGGIYWQDKEPGKYFEYTNLNFPILATIIEKVSGERFDIFMKKKIFDPLKITATFNPNTFTKEEAENKVTIYRKLTDDKKIHKSGKWISQMDDYQTKLGENIVIVFNPLNDEYTFEELKNYKTGDNGSIFSPQGGLRVSLKDLIVIMKDLIFRQDNKILDDSLLKEMLSSNWRYIEDEKNGETFDGLMLNYGLSTHILSNKKSDTISNLQNLSLKGHLGEAHGLYSGFFFDEIKKSGIIYFITGVGKPVEDGLESSFYRVEEKILNAVGNEYFK
ncbi:MAG: serine hydrolase domain-containing protein [Cetobacterium sp.]